MRAALAVFAMCALPRLCATAFWPAETESLYYQLAGEWLATGRQALGGEIGVRIEPVYAAVLAVSRAVSGDRVFAVQAIQILVASAAGVVFFALARQLSGSRRTAWVAAALYAGSPYLVRQSAAFMEITWAVAILIVAVWLVTAGGGPARSAAAGAVLAAIVLTRWSFAPIAIGMLAILMRRPRAGAVAAAVCAACLAAWVAIARGSGGAVVPHRIGENLFVSTSAWAGPVIPRVNVDVLLPPAEALVTSELGRPATPIERDRILLRHALDFVRRHPLQAVTLKLENLVWVLQPRLLPFTERSGSADVVDGELRIPPQTPRPLFFELIGGGFQALLLAGGAAGMWKRRRRLLAEDAPLIVVVLSVIALNVLFFPTSRLLAPMTFVLMFYTAVAVDPRQRP